MSKYIVTENIIRVTESETLSVLNKLPVGTYELGADKQGFFLNHIEEMDNIPERVYGNSARRVERIITTFKYRKGCNTGVMLSGIKGTGKTLMTRMLTLRAAEEGLPTIVINTAFPTNVIAQFLRSVDVPCVVVFDEFDKTFKEKKDDDGDDKDNNVQGGLLSILDGVYSSHKLFVFSLNEVKFVNEYLLSRPGRVFYHYKFTSLDAQTIEEYCEDRLINKENISDIVMVSHFIKDFTFDILSAIVAECNNYNEKPQQFIKDLNVDLGIKGDYKIEVIHNETGTVVGSSNAYINSSNETNYWSDGYTVVIDDKYCIAAEDEDTSEIQKMIPELKEQTETCDSTDKIALFTGNGENFHLNLSSDSHTFWDVISGIDKRGNIMSIPLCDGRISVRFSKISRSYDYEKMLSEHGDDVESYYYPDTESSRFSSGHTCTLVPKARRSVLPRVFLSSSSTESKCHE